MSVIYLLKLQTSNAANVMIKIIANNYNNKIIIIIIIISNNIYIYSAYKIISKRFT